jgi:hypothetical protein
MRGAATSAAAEVRAAAHGMWNSAATAAASTTASARSRVNSARYGGGYGNDSEDFDRWHGSTLERPPRALPDERAQPGVE